jgi:indolepyruvate ferredoxin oxidoreductase beta subunit
MYSDSVQEKEGRSFRVIKLKMQIANIKIFNPKSEIMKNDIILSGVGGQGILSIAAAIGFAAVENNLFLKQSEVHGMSQRGGDVQSHLRLSDKPVASDLIPYGQADLIISVEPMESLRYLPWLSENGWLVTNSKPFINIPEYPPVGKILNEIKKVKNNIIIDADSIAKESGSVKASNIVILGAASHFISMPFASLENAVKRIFERKGEKIVSINLKAIRAGKEFSAKQL